MAAHPKTPVRVVLGIAGGSGSGKSWLAKAVAEAFSLPSYDVASLV